MLPYSEDLDADGIHVQAASDVVFLCGGPYSDISEPIPLSLRDAFLKISEYSPLKERVLLLAEDVTKADSFSDSYDNILEFETDLAQIVELIILFCESEGSLAEFGAFAMIDEIAKRLFVVVRQMHWKANSFVRLGPLRLIVIQRADVRFRHEDRRTGCERSGYIYALCRRLNIFSKTDRISNGCKGFTSSSY